MAVVVGYVPTAEGRAALRQAAQECKLRNTRLVVINSQRGGNAFDAFPVAWQTQMNSHARTTVREMNQMILNHKGIDAKSRPDFLRDVAQSNQILIQRANRLSSH